jgi:CHAD domain-containing protein
MARQPVVYSIGNELDERRIARWVPGTERAGPARVALRTLLDTFDGRLHSEGLTLWREGRGAATVLHLERSGSLPMTAPLAVTTQKNLLASELPEGVLGDLVRDAIEERALLPRLAVRVRTQPLKVCNDDGKTVVRLSIEEPTLAGKGGPAGSRVAVGRRLSVSPVLGYDRELRRAVDALGRRLPPADGLWHERALVEAGIAPGGVSSDVDVRLDRDMRADQAMGAICRRLAEVVEANLPGVLADIDPEFLHDLRVAVRRSRSVLKEMRAVLPAETAARARTDLRWIQEVTGPTRDLDVLLHDWPLMVEPVPVAMAGDLQPLVDLLTREREEVYATMRRHLRGRKYTTAWQAWRNAVADETFDGADAGRPIGELASGRIVTVYHGMVKMGSAIDDSSPPIALHDLRKKGKELRYLLELFGGMWAADKVKPLVSTLKGLQDELGHFQDDEIQVAELRHLGPALAAAPGGTDSLIALGFVVEGLASRQHQARRAFAGRFADFSQPSTRRVVEQTFR